MPNTPPTVALAYIGAPRSLTHLVADLEAAGATRVTITPDGISPRSFSGTIEGLTRDRVRWVVSRYLVAARGERARVLVDGAPVRPGET